jgi:hypothetical protein
LSISPAASEREAATSPMTRAEACGR